MIMYRNCSPPPSCFLLCYAVSPNFLPLTFLFTSRVSLCDSAHKPELRQAKLSDSCNPFNVYARADHTSEIHCYFWSTDTPGQNTFKNIVNGME